MAVTESVHIHPLITRTPEVTLFEVIAGLEHQGTDSWARVKNISVIWADVWWRMDHYDSWWFVQTNWSFTNHMFIFTLNPDLSLVLWITKFEWKDQGRIKDLLCDVDIVVIVVVTECTNELLGEVWAVVIRGPQTNVSNFVAPNVNCNGKWQTMN